MGNRLETDKTGNDRKTTTVDGVARWPLEEGLGDEGNVFLARSTKLV